MATYVAAQLGLELAECSLLILFRLFLLFCHDLALDKSSNLTYVIETEI